MDADSQSGALPLADDHALLIVEVFRMLADATRIQLLWALAGGEMSVNDLAERIGKPGPSVSQHLAKLRMARVVRTRREGTQVFYRLENDHVRQLLTDAVFNAEHAAGGIPAHHRGDREVRVLGEGAADGRRA
jgi:DNA-binding transcriptional ArsR family regulator